MTDTILDLEDALRHHTGAPYAVCVNSGSAALFLAAVYSDVNRQREVWLPAYTDPGAACAIVNAGGRVAFHRGHEWQREGCYHLNPTYIVDSAHRVERNGYKGGLVCLSFNFGCPIAIGHGGAILCSSCIADAWLRSARMCGRTGLSLPNDRLECAGWPLQMVPSMAVLALERLAQMPDLVVSEGQAYQDLSKYPFFTEANRGQGVCPQPGAVVQHA